MLSIRLVGDFNGDGKPDLATATYDQSGLTVLLAKEGLNTVDRSLVGLQKLAATAITHRRQQVIS